MRYVAILVLLVAACGKPGVNPCLTKGATYLAESSQASGNCGELPDQLINVTKDGEIPANVGVTCDSSEADECVQRTTNCRKTADGLTCSSTGSVEFSKDGATGSGSVSITCSGTATCSSNYNVRYTRKN